MVQKKKNNSGGNHFFSSLSIRIITFSLCALLYVFLYVQFRPVLGVLVTSISLALVVCGYYFFGSTLSAVTLLSVLPLNTVLLLNMDLGIDLFSINRVGGAIVFLLFGSGLIYIIHLYQEKVEEERIIRLVLDTTEVGFWRYFPGRKKIEVDQRFLEIMGLTTKKISFQQWTSMFEPECRIEMEKLIQDLEGAQKKRVSLQVCASQPNGLRIVLGLRGRLVDTGISHGGLHIIGVISDITDEQARSEQLVNLANRDQVTGLENRRSFFDRAKETLAQARRSVHEGKRSIIVINLDGFRDVNETYGHEVGDVLLKKTASRLKSIRRSSDYLFHTGPDEFVYILYAVENEIDIAVFARRVVELFRDPFEIDGHLLYIGSSTGIANYPQDGEDPVTLYKYANTALHNGKKLGIPFSFYTKEMQQKAEERMAIIQDLQNALRNREFELHYQPLMTRQNTIAGVEALVRWRKADGTLVFPGDFISFAEEIGLIVQIGRWVIHKACEDCSRWLYKGIGKFPVSVNISVVQLRDSALVSYIEHCLKKFELSADYLHLEITETSFLENMDEFLPVIEKITRMGIGVSIDDFGTGYSSFTYLKTLPVNTIKIDRSFIVGLPTNKDDIAIVSSIISLAHGLNLRVIAEGVDSEEQLEFLYTLNCNLIQGYLHSKPLNEEALYAFLEKNRESVEI